MIKIIKLTVPINNYMSGRARPTFNTKCLWVGPVFSKKTLVDLQSVSFFHNFIRFSNLVGWYRCNRRCDLPYWNIRRDYDQGKYTDVFNVTKDQIPRRENGNFRWRIRWDIWRLLVLPQSTKQGRIPSWNLPQGKIAFLDHQNPLIFPFGLFRNFDSHKRR